MAKATFLVFISLFEVLILIIFFSLFTAVLNVHRYAFSLQALHTVNPPLNLITKTNSEFSFFHVSTNKMKCKRRGFKINAIFYLQLEYKITVDKIVVNRFHDLNMFRVKSSNKRDHEQRHFQNFKHFPPSMSVQGHSNNT